MESITASTPSDKMFSMLQDETDSLDSLVRTLTRKKPLQQDKDEIPREQADVWPLLYLQQPLPLALGALRQGVHDPRKQALGHGAEPVAMDSEGENVTNHVNETQEASSGQDKSNPLRISALTGKGGAETSVHSVHTDAPKEVRSGAVIPATAVSDPATKRASEHKRFDEKDVSILPTSQPVPLTSPRVRIESSNMMLRQEPVPMQTEVVPNVQQGGLTYRFSRWGADHTVSVQGQTGGTLVLQPSDTLVAQQLSDQWQSGNPQKWQLTPDGGEGRRQRHQQEHEEDES